MVSKVYYQVFFTTLLATSCLLWKSAAQTIPKSLVVNMCQSGGMFALTFDQGPSIYTGTVLDALASRQVKASFHPVVTFLNDASVVANLMRAAEEGHTIGLALEQQIDLSNQSNDDIFSTLDSRCQSIQASCGVYPKFLRIHNYQNMSSDQLQFILSKGWVITTYNLDSYDYDKPDVLGSFKAVLDTLSPRTKGMFISVQRDIVQNSVNQVPEIIDYIQEKGYNLVTLEQCVRNGGGTGPSGSQSPGAGDGKKPASGGSGSTGKPAVVQQTSSSQTITYSPFLTMLPLLAAVLFAAL